MYYKDYREIAEKASIPLKTYLKSLPIHDKTSISLKKSSKIIEIFIQTRSLNFSGNVFKKPRYVYKILILIKKKPPLL
jgi:hypothetical protein